MIFTLLLNTAVFAYSNADVLPNRMEIPPCPPGSQKYFTPDPQRPLWVGCKDAKGLFQGFLVQMSYQGEVVRVAAMRNSLRHGKEIRFGASGTIEERGYDEGHLENDSMIFKTDVLLNRVIPKELKSKDWLPLFDSTKPSLFSTWSKLEPISVVTYKNGRLVRVRFSGKDYSFKVSPDGRIFALNHPEMKNLFFIDPGAFWNLNADDLKSALLPGFGSCKKYSGPIGRFGRHYDRLLYVRQVSQKKHLEELAEIRERFIKFCLPQDLREHLGVLECPPQLPNMPAPNRCLMSVSDQIRIPYLPKYFKYEFTLKKDPETFVKDLDSERLLKFMAIRGQEFMEKHVPPKTMIVVKKKGNQLIYRIYPEHGPNPKVFNSELEEREWWLWKLLPGFE